MVSKALILMFSMLYLAGCSSVSIGPIEAGEDSYVISKQPATFSSEEDDLLASILAQANAYCLEKKLNMEVKHLNEYTGFFGNDTKTTLVFACLSEEDETYQPIAPVVIATPVAPVQPTTPAPEPEEPKFFPQEKLTNYAF